MEVYKECGHSKEWHSGYETEPTGDRLVRRNSICMKEKCK